MRRTRKLAVFLLLLLSSIAGSALRLYHAGYRINLSPSVPTGIWRIVEGGHEKGGYAAVSPNAHYGYSLAVERSYLPGFSPMLKRVAAAEGDVIDYDEEEKAVTVNGEYIMMTEIISRDTEGRPLPRASFPVTLERGQVWLSSENIRGYDSRYFGPVSSDILRRATPVWIFR
jgi:conjugative transfer signal peptidase TraF